MDRRQLIEHSLTRQKVEKLIIFLGNHSESVSQCRGAVATRVCGHLLTLCKPSPADIHDPHTNRLHSRDANGRARQYYDARASALGHRGKQRQRQGVGAVRSPQLWDSERVADYMGRWCDRLLLGDHQQPMRSAVLEPRVPAALQGEAVARVAQSHRYLAAKDVLVVSAHPDLPVGVIRQYAGLLVATGGDGSSPGPVVPGTTALDRSMQYFKGAPAECTSLLIGVGDQVGPLGTFTAAEEDRLSSCLVPLASFASALWTTNPTRSSAYVESVTPTADHLNRENANTRLWKTMHASMLSTRDTAVLRAHYTGTSLDARLSEQHTEYLAHTLLDRLGDNNNSKR